jgi:hypothetical protein
VANFVDLLRFFKVRILEDEALFETAVDIDVNVPVDGGGDEESAMLFVIRREVGASTAERNA